ncbi:MAG: hypothetical protein KIS78_06400 [Labilithrix sp.]|nr:hypothetical protein [Labilithrix sp.]
MQRRYGRAYLVLVTSMTVAFACSPLFDLGRVDERYGEVDPDGDAGDAAPDVAAPGFCAAADASALVVCDDFDGVQAPSSVWESSLTVPGCCTVVPESLSPPNAYQLDIDASAFDAGFRLAVLSTPTAAPADHLTFAFALRPAAFPATGGAFYAASIAQDNGGTRAALSLRLASADVDLQEQIGTSPGTFRQSAAAPARPLDAWTRFEIELDLAALPRRARLRIEGAEAISFELSPEWGKAVTRLYVGNWFVSADIAHYRVIYDDVAIHAR